MPTLALLPCAGIYLNDVIIDFYLNHLRSAMPEADQKRFRLLSPHFYVSVRTSPQMAARKWEKAPPAPHYPTARGTP